MFLLHICLGRCTLPDSYLRLASKGNMNCLFSDVVLRELKAAREPKRTKLLSQVGDLVELSATLETEGLAREYVRKGVISDNFIDDARHVSIATVNNLDAVVSWNYGHLVNINKIRGVNVINEIMGYKHIEIVSPEEVIENGTTKS